MRIIHITTELAPIAKVGGLGDVVYGLAKEQKKLGHQVEIILPKFDCIDLSQMSNLKMYRDKLFSCGKPERFNNTPWEAEVDDLKINLIESHHPAHFFNRKVIYGCPDDTSRFIYFCLAAMEYLFKSNQQPDVVHVHDWPTALVPVLYREVYIHLGYRLKGCILTIHNLQHQGKCPPSELSHIGLSGAYYLNDERLGDPYYPHLINLLKGGIVYSDQVTTVSPNYKKEIQTREGGFGLEETVKKYQAKLSGILNGIDETFWNPQTDRYLIKKYDTNQVDTAERLQLLLAGKKENRLYLLNKLQLDESNQPIVASVTRLVPQKGPELIKAAMQRTVAKGGQFILLGSSPIPEVCEEFKQLRETYKKENQKITILMDQAERLAHLIFAAADLFLIPSLFEPCGLTQMIALRYGTIPVARSTGGLADTVFDIETSSLPENRRNGFTFDDPDEPAVCQALDRAIDCFNQNPKRWEELICAGTRIDFTWAQAGLKYMQIYERLKYPQTV